MPDKFMARTEKKVIGVAEDDGGFEIFPKVPLGEAFDSGLSADGHERGRGNVTVFGVENTGAGTSVRALGEKFEGDLAGQIRL
jgi:hypothetical protein